jgi:hypothetical protein
MTMPDGWVQTIALADPGVGVGQLVSLTDDAGGLCWYQVERIDTEPVDDDMPDGCWRWWLRPVNPDL